MGFRINNNISALIAQGNTNKTQSKLTMSIERLSSGLRINRGADDAAGLTISEKLRGQIRGLNRAVSNAQDGISLIQTAEGALNEDASILNRLRELAIQSQADSLTANDRLEIQKEVDQMVDEVDRISKTTEFNTKKLLDGSSSSLVSADHKDLEIMQVGEMDSSLAGDYKVRVRMEESGERQVQKSAILTNKNNGNVAGLSTQLKDITTFFDNDGNNVLETPSNITLRGNSAKADLTISSDMTRQEMTNAIESKITDSTENGGLGLTGVATPASNSASTTTDRATGVLVGIDCKFEWSSEARFDGTVAGEDAIFVGTQPLIFTIHDTNAQHNSQNPSNMTSGVTIALTASRTFLVSSIVSYINSAIAVSKEQITSLIYASNLSSTDVSYRFDAGNRLDFFSRSSGEDARIVMSTVNNSMATSAINGFGINISSSTQGSVKTDFNIHIADRKLTFQIGANKSQRLDFGVINTSAKALNIHDLDVTNTRSATTALGKIDNAVNAISSERSKLGSLQNRLTSTVNNLTVTATNLQSTESKIRDVNIDVETVAFTRNQILIQAGTTQLSQARGITQGALQLLG